MPIGRSAYQRNDYIGWVTRVKLESTKQRRLAQMLDELAKGDSYMKMHYNPDRERHSMKPSISLITLGVDNLQRSLAFYRDGLGWPVAQTDNDDVAFFQMSNGVVLSIFLRYKLAEDANIAATGSGYCAMTLAHNVGSEGEVDAVIATVEKLGAKITKKPQKAFWGGYTAFFADPDGHLWEVAYNPHWGLDKKGAIVFPKS